MLQLRNAKYTPPTQQYTPSWLKIYTPDSGNTLPAVTAVWCVCHIRPHVAPLICPYIYMRIPFINTFCSICAQRSNSSLHVTSTFISSTERLNHENQCNRDPKRANLTTDKSLRDSIPHSLSDCPQEKLLTDHTVCIKHLTPGSIAKQNPDSSLNVLTSDPLET